MCSSDLVMMGEPLAGIRIEATCMKPASFGTSLFVSVGDQRTRDLSCPATPTGEALKDDAEQVAQFLRLENLPRRPGGGVLPGGH